MLQFWKKLCAEKHRWRHSWNFEKKFWFGNGVWNQCFISNNPIFAAQKNGKTDFDRVLEDNEAIKIDEESANESKTEIDDDDESEADWAPITKKSSAPSLVSQFEFNDLVRELGLLKDGSELMTLFLKRKNLLEPKTKVTIYRNRESQFRKYLMNDEDSSLVFCTDVKGPINELKANCYDDKD